MFHVAININEQTAKFNRAIATGDSGTINTIYWDMVGEIIRLNSELEQYENDSVMEFGQTALAGA